MKTFAAALILLSIAACGYAGDAAAARCEGAAPAIVSLFAAPTNNSREFIFTAAADSPDTMAYRWDFGDGTVVDGAAAETHAFASGGDYTVSVTASSRGVASNPSTLNVNTEVAPRILYTITPFIVKKTFTIGFINPSLNKLNFKFQAPGLVYPNLQTFTAVFQGSVVNVYVGGVQVDTMLLVKTKGKGFGSFTYTYKKGIVEYKSSKYAPLTAIMNALGAVNGTGTGFFSAVLEIDVVKGLDVFAIFNTAVFSYKATINKKGQGK